MPLHMHMSSLNTCKVDERPGKYSSTCARCRKIHDARQSLGRADPSAPMPDLCSVDEMKHTRSAAWMLAQQQRPGRRGVCGLAVYDSLSADIVLPVGFVVLLTRLSGIHDVPLETRCKNVRIRHRNLRSCGGGAFENALHPLGKLWGWRPDDSFVTVPGSTG